MRTRRVIGRAAAAAVMLAGLLVWPSMTVRAENNIHLQNTDQQTAMAAEVTAVEQSGQEAAAQEAGNAAAIDPVVIEEALQMVADQQAIIEQALQDQQTYMQNVQEAAAGQSADLTQEAQAMITQQQLVIEQLLLQQQALLTQHSQLQLLAQQYVQPVMELPAGPEIVFVGDSRTVQMETAVGANPYVWISKISQGYKWFSETAVPQVDAVVGNGTKVVINLGVNDVANVDKYARLVNEKAAEWTAKGAAVYYASVNPVKDGQYIRRSMVPVFNSRLKKLLSSDIQWIDSYSYLETAGYSLPDGLHYDKGTYKKIYNYYLSHIL